MSDSFVPEEELSLWSAPFGLVLLDKVPYKTSITVLDIGCGIGFPVIELAQRLGSSSILYGLDPDKKSITHMMDKCELLGIKNINPIHCCGEYLPLKTNSVDLIVSNNGLNNVQDLNQVLSQCSRVLKPGGQLIFTVNLPGSFKEFYVLLEERLQKIQGPSASAKIQHHIWEKRKPLEELLQILRNNNFVLQDVSEDLFYLKFASYSAFSSHSFIRTAFFPRWEELVPEQFRTTIFQEIGKCLDANAEQTEGIHFTIPFVCISCTTI